MRSIKQNLYKCIMFVVLLISVTFAQASVLDYKFEVKETGNVSAIVAPTSAGYENHLHLVVNGVPSQVYINNHLSPNWSVINFGVFEAGTEVGFMVDVVTTGDKWWSDSSKNSDWLPHMQTLGTLDQNFIYTGFEDLRWNGDWDFNDSAAYWSNISVTAAVPEPSTLMMLLIGLGLIPLIKREKV